MAKLNISQREYEQQRAQGRTKEQIIAANSTSPGFWGSPLVRGAKKLTEIAGFKGVNDYVSDMISPIALATDPSIQNKLDAQRYLPDTGFSARNLKRVAGSGAQLSTLISPTTRAASLVGRVATGAASGALAMGGQAAAEDQDAGTIAKQARVGATIGGVVPLASEAIKKTGSSVYKFFIPRDKQEAILLQTYKAKVPFMQRMQAAFMGKNKVPRQMADTAFDAGMKGTEGHIGIQATRAKNKLWSSLIEPQLDEADEVVDMNAFFAEARKNIVDSTPELSRQKSLLKAIDAIAEDYAEKPTATIKDMQKLKEGWAEFVPERMYRGESVAAAINEVRYDLASLARKKIYSSVAMSDDAIRQAYIDYGNLMGLQKLGQAAMTGEKLERGAGSLTMGLIKKVMTPVATIGGRTVYRVGDTIELVGRPGLNTVGQFILDLTNESPQQSNTEPTELTQ